MQSYEESIMFAYTKLSIEGLNEYSISAMNNVNSTDHRA
jgi:hypothetical protein